MSEPIHPALMGLLELLPQPGYVFTEAERRTWLQAVCGALKLIYEEKPPPSSQPPST